MKIARSISMISANILKFTSLTRWTLSRSFYPAGRLLWSYFLRLYYYIFRNVIMGKHTKGRMKDACQICRLFNHRPNRFDDALLEDLLFWRRVVKFNDWSVWCDSCWGSQLLVWVITYSSISNYNKLMYLRLFIVFITLSCVSCFYVQNYFPNYTYYNYV